MKSLKNYLQENGVITTKDAERLGYSRQVLSQLAKSGKLERIRDGIYQLEGEVIDDFVLISSNSSRVIFSYQTSLYLHDLTDRTPNIFHISVPQGYNASHIKNRFSNVQVHYVKNKWHTTGIEQIRTPLGNIVPVYDMERTICDLIKDRKRVDKQIFSDGINRYFRSSNKNLRNLIKYSKLFGMEQEVRKYMEVLI